MCESGQWPKDFTEVTVTALQKIPKATKRSDNCTISLMVHTAKHTAKTVGRRVRRWIERKIEDVFVEDQSRFRKCKGTRDEIWMPNITLERTLDIDEELCVCFINWP
jgi:hypothetical protein